MFLPAFGSCKAPDAPLGTPSPETGPRGGIEAEGISLQLDGRPVLRDVTLRITERRVALIGPNGSGKTTFARCLNGLVVPDCGRVTVDGLDTRSDAARVRRRIGFVFQNPEHQIVFPTVGEDIAFGLKNQKRSHEDIRTAVDAILDRFGVPELKDRAVHDLSGGEKRLVTLLSVLVMEPAYLILDEPTTFLDLRGRRRLGALLRDLPQSIVMITHDLDMVAEFDRVIAFENGQVAFDGEPASAIRHYVETQT